MCSELRHEQMNQLWLKTILFCFYCYQESSKVSHLFNQSFDSSHTSTSTLVPQGRHNPLLTEEAASRWEKSHWSAFLLGLVLGALLGPFIDVVFVARRALTVWRDRWLAWALRERAQQQHKVKALAVQSKADSDSSGNDSVRQVSRHAGVKSYGPN